MCYRYDVLTWKAFFFLSFVFTWTSINVNLTRLNTWQTALEIADVLAGDYIQWCLGSRN